MADFVSAYTGEQIEAAIKAVAENKDTWDKKPTTEDMNTAIANAIGTALEASY